MNEQIVSSGMAQLRDPQEVLKPAGTFSAEQVNFSDDSQRDEETQAFEQASEARVREVVKTKERRKKPKEQLLLLPADKEAATNAVKLRARDLDVKLKKMLAWVVMIAVCSQLAVSDFFLIYYVVTSEKPSEPLIIAWLSASVVEVIAIVVVIARNLFPDRNGKSKTKAKRSKG